MKSITILFLPIFFLYADSCKTPISETIIENAKLVTKQGWSKAEEPLKEFIEKDGHESIKSFLQTAVTPYEIIFSNGNPLLVDSVPKLNLTITDNYYALAHAKYFESQNKIEEALEIYRTILKGLKQANMNNPNMIGLIYRIVIEKMCTESIKESIQRNKFTAQQRTRLHEFLKNYLLLDAELFYLALEDERYYVKKSCERDIVNNKAAFLHYPSVNKLIEDTDLNQVIFQEICKRADQKREAINKKIYQISNEEESRSLENTLKSEQAKLYQWLATLQEKSAPDLEKLRSDPTNFINSIGDILFYVGRPKLSSVKLDILQNIESNKKLLGELQAVQTPNKAVEPIKNPQAAF